MFEKEAEEYARKNTSYYGTDDCYDTDTEKVEQVFKDAAEFGYNKANEWCFTNRNKEHQVIDCPKGEENKLYLLFLNSSDSKEFEFGRKFLSYVIGTKNGVDLKDWNTQ